MPAHVLDVDLEALEEFSEPVLAWRNRPKRLRKVECVDHSWRTAAFQKRWKSAPPVLLINQPKVIGGAVIGDNTIGVSAERSERHKHLVERLLLGVVAGAQFVPVDEELVGLVR